MEAGAREELRQRMERPIAIGVMAFNEEGNIARLLDSILNQSAFEKINRVLVIASGCTDRTCAIVDRYAAEHPKIQLVAEPERGGKVRAINTFFAIATEPVLLVSSADLIYEPQTVEALTAPLADPAVGMVGSHPVPLNAAGDFIGFTVQLMWRLHHEVSLRNPKMGELIAFRNVFRGLNPDTPADEVQIEHGVRSVGYEIRYAPDAIVHNRGPESLKEFVAQRTRWIALNMRIQRKHRLPVSTLRATPLLEAMVAYVRREHPRWDWLAGAALLEVYCRIRAAMQYSRWNSGTSTGWDPVASTKQLVHDEANHAHVGAGT
jgi:glycosyltransferase involved in cell wall biosynthesis